jgi:pilus assembly protein CpaB
MRALFLAVLLLGLALAGFSVYLARGYVGAYQTALAQERAARTETVELVDVYVAARRLNYGEHVAADDIRRVRWPADALPEGAFSAEEDLVPAAGGAARTVLRVIEKDEPLLAAKLTEPGEDAGVSARLPRGMRAFAIRVDVASGVSGFLRPGDRVDVYWSGRIGGDALESEVTKLIESGVGLLAVDQSADGDRGGPLVARTVTVAATPLQVAGLAQAQSTGRLSLALVGAADDGADDGDVAAIAVDQRTLLGLAEERQVAADPAPRTCTIRTRRGADVVEMPIPCTN